MRFSGNKFPLFLGALVWLAMLQNCKLEIISGGGVVDDAKCEIYSAHSCTDTLVWNSDTGFVFSWDAENRRAYGGHYLNGSPFQLFESVYSRDLSRDSTLWYNNVELDTLFRGFSVFEYFESGMLYMERQYNATRENDSLKNLLPVLRVEYKAAGTLHKRTEIFSGDRAVVQLMNEFEMPKKEYTYFLSDSSGGDADTIFYFYQSQDFRVLSALSQYTGPQLRDSTGFDGEGRKILGLTYHEEGWLRIKAEITYVGPDEDNILESVETLYESPNVVVSVTWRNGEGLIIRRQTGNGPVIQCAEPLEFSGCKAEK